MASDAQKAPTRGDYRAAAQRLYTGHGGGFSDGDVNVDDHAAVSDSDDGAYVAAWVWVSRDDAATIAR